MSNLKILDCTLRDGGYVNNWQFGHKNITNIIKNLAKANIDFIECGFLKPIDYDTNKSLFSCISDLNDHIKSLSANVKYTFMINFGEYDIEKLPVCANKNIMLRVVFK